MSKRTVQAYESVFSYISTNIIPRRGDAIIMDFEKAMRKGLQKVLKSEGSNLMILGCWFHYCQALRRKTSAMSTLFELIRTNEKHRHIFRKFQCLPLLPEHHIEPTFKTLAMEALKLDKEVFAPFINYFNNEWIKIVTPHHFCVYKRDKRTTGDAESCNGRMNNLFKVHGSFFTFCVTLQKVEVTTANELQNYVNGTLQQDKTSKFYKKRAKTIRQISIDYKDKPNLMINALANPKNKALYQDDEIFAEPEDSHLKESVELYGNDDAIVYKEIQLSDESDDETENSK